MSNVNVKPLVENIRSGTNVYTPLVELVVNAIQAIDAKGIQNGLVEIEVLRNRQDSPHSRGACRLHLQRLASRHDCFVNKVVNVLTMGSARDAERQPLKFYV